MSPDLLAHVRRAITSSRWLEPHGRVVVAVSGGADSVALLHLLLGLQRDLKLTLHVAHLDHALREASAGDAEFVRQLGARWSLGTTIERRDVGAIVQEAGWSLEDGARRIRHQFLLEVAQRQRAQRIVLAHTADDQAETVLMRLVRGTGLLGLGAIPAVRQLDEGRWLVRPLLEVWRADILQYLEEASLTYRTDATNDDQRFVRNRIRHHLLPLLERDYNPNIKGTLTQLAEQSRTDYAFLRQAAGRQWKRTVKPKRPDRLAISVRALLRQPKAIQRQLVRQAIQELRGDTGRLEFRHWLEVERLLTERPVGTRLDLPGGVRMHREKDQMVCERSSPSTIGFPCVTTTHRGIL